MITKILEVLSNALSVISNFTSNIVVKIVIIIIILGAWIFRYAKKSTSKAISAVIVMLVILLIGGMASKSHPPKPKETIPPIESSVPTLTPSITPTQIENNEPTEISICDANVLDDNIFYDGDMAEQDVYENVYDSYVWAVMGGAGFNPTIQSETYLLQGKYNRFTGKLFVRKEDPSNNSFIMKVYLDGVQKYKSEIITKEMGAYEFDCDITGANKVKVEFSMVDGDGVGRAFLADGKFVKD